ncbi:MAG: relaxase, partial [Rhizobiales bacterium]|nr:relaxase [Hyphomicrobiales bacterium]
HAAERLALDAVQLAERQKPFTGAAIRLFALIERVPGLRSILAPIIKNPALNPAQRQAQAQKSLRRRHEREKALHQRRLDVLAKLEARERKSLRTSLTRKLRLEEAERVHKARERIDQFVANTKDITEPTLAPRFTANAAGKEGWRQRQERLNSGRSAKHNRPRGYRLGRDDTS